MKTMTRITGICGILVFGLSIVAIGLVASTGLAEQDLEAGAVDTVLQSMTAISGIFVVSMWIFLNANSLGATFGIGCSKMSVLGFVLPCSLLSLVSSPSSSKH